MLRTWQKAIVLVASFVIGAQGVIGKPKKAKKSAETKASASEPASPRVLIYDTEHPSGPPAVVSADAAPKIPDAPLFHLKMGAAGSSKEGVEPEDISVTEKPVIMDKTDGKPAKKKKSKPQSE